MGLAEAEEGLVYELTQQMDWGLNDAWGSMMNGSFVNSLVFCQQYTGEHSGK